jgi:phosphatidylserine decarboxylase
MYIHKEGHTLLLSTIVVVLLVLTVLNFTVGQGPFLFFVAIFGAIIFLGFLQFFRNPTPNTVLNSNHIIAPADGKVVVIEQVEEVEFFKDKRIQVSIFMSPINVHVNRNPISGIVKYFKYHPGKYLVAWHPKASTENERTTVVVEHQKGTQVLFRQIAGALAKRIKWYIKEGDSVNQAEEFGFIKFGSRVDIFLPLNTQINVQLNQKTTGGETVIATLS